ncbi:MAG TPA: envelope biogenesis factor ElyC, partial [Alcanivorax sp.]|nr:envelope biogenesis factor ElyC [Alcanivorax sp.]
MSFQLTKLAAALLMPLPLILGLLILGLVLLYLNRARRLSLVALTSGTLLLLLLSVPLLPRQ